jgi:hypothetical protein
MASQFRAIRPHPPDFQTQLPVLLDMAARVREMNLRINSTKPKTTISGTGHAECLPPAKQSQLAAGFTQPTYNSCNWELTVIFTEGLKVQDAT